jgi:hypothetical protein
MIAYQQFGGGVLFRTKVLLYTHLYDCHPLIPFERPTPSSFNQTRCNANVSQQEACVTMIQLEHLRRKVGYPTSLNEIDLKILTETEAGFRLGNELANGSNNSEMRYISIVQLLGSVIDLRRQSIRGRDPESIEWERAGAVNIRTKKIHCFFG